jgi:hypothetical protein
MGRRVSDSTENSATKGPSDSSRIKKVESERLIVYHTPYSLVTGGEGQIID